MHVGDEPHILAIIGEIYNGTRRSWLFGSPCAWISLAVRPLGRARKGDGGGKQEWRRKKPHRLWTPARGSWLGPGQAMCRPGGRWPSLGVVGEGHAGVRASRVESQGLLGHAGVGPVVASRLCPEVAGRWDMGVVVVGRVALRCCSCAPGRLASATCMCAVGTGGASGRVPARWHMRPFVATPLPGPFRGPHRIDIRSHECRAQRGSSAISGRTRGIPCPHMTAARHPVGS